MRLIDADKLVEICRKGWKLFGRENEKLKHWVDEDDIRNQPTVNAIPIEWIREFSKKQKRGNYRDFIDFMITYWERENGLS